MNSLVIFYTILIKGPIISLNYIANAIFNNKHDIIIVNIY